MVAIPTDAFNKWHWQKTVEFPAQAVDVIHYLQDALAQCRAEMERLQGIVADAAFAPGNATLRAEVERLKTQLAFSADTRDHLRARIAELELLLRHVLCQADANSTINLDAIRAALAGTKEGDKSDDA